LARNRAADLHRNRVLHFHESVIGRRRFAGQIIINDVATSVARSLAYETTPPPKRTELVFWTDASYKADLGGALGAGVVHQDPVGYKFITFPFPIGRNVGSAGDAEVYAVAAALDLALHCVSLGSNRPVVIFTDCLNLLHSLQYGNVSELGPLQSPRWALEDVYERAEALEAAGIKLSLRWIKGHRSGAGGNPAADAAADLAAKLAAKDETQQIEEDTIILPRELLHADRNLREEFLYRAKHRCNPEAPIPKVRVVLEGQRDVVMTQIWLKAWLLGIDGEGTKDKPFTLEDTLEDWPMVKGTEDSLSAEDTEDGYLREGTEDDPIVL
jgi:ribonuclease HI